MDVAWLLRGCRVTASWLPRGCRVVTAWRPRGCAVVAARLPFHGRVDVFWLTRGFRVVSPHGSRVVSLWLPRGCWVAAIWLPCGRCVVTAWSACGCRSAGTRRLFLLDETEILKVCCHFHYSHDCLTLKEPVMPKAFAVLCGSRSLTTSHLNEPGNHSYGCCDLHRCLCV